MKAYRKILSILLLSGLAACGGETGNSDAFDREDEVLPEPETLQKIYRADLRALTPQSDAEGQAIVRLEDDSFEVNIAMRNLDRGTHRQFIAVGKTCPAADEVLIPLDDDLDGIQNDSGQYPDSGFIGAYAYREDTTRAQLVRELGPEPEISFDDRTIVIMRTVGNQNLLVACGELTPVIGSE